VDANRTARRTPARARTRGVAQAVAGGLEALDLPGPAVRIFVWSRLAIGAGLLFVIVAFRPAWFHEPAATIRHPPGPGSFIDEWARWDAQWFLHIARQGYGGGGDAAFFPLYPGMVAGLGRLLGSQYVVAGILISLAACLGSFTLLYRVGEPRLGSDGARRAVLYLAIFPMALFLQSVYSESLYLVLTLAAFMLAERHRFLGAGVTAGLAMLTRAGAVALLPALALLAWREPTRARSLAKLAVAPAMFAAYPLLLWRQIVDPWGFAHAEATWHRHTSATVPLGPAWDGLKVGWTSIRGLWMSAVSHGSSGPVRPELTNIEYAAFLLLFIPLTVVAWRRFGAPYGVFALFSLAVPLSVPASGKPLLSLPRFGLAIFPLFLALAALGERPRVHRTIIVVSACLLSLHLIDWSFGGWVS